MSILKFKETISSESATKLQTANAKAFFGTKGAKILATLEVLHKAKELNTEAKLNPLFDFLKNNKEEAVLLFARSKSGRLVVRSYESIANSKTVIQVINALRQVKVPKAWAQSVGSIPAKAGRAIAPGAGAKTAASAPARSMETLQTKVDPKGDWSPIYLCKQAGVRVDPRANAGVFTTSKDVGVMYEPSGAAPDKRVIHIIANSTDLGTAALRGKGAITVATVVLPANHMLDQAVRKNVTQLGMFSTFADAYHMFLSAVSGATNVASTSQQGPANAQPAPSFLELRNAMSKTDATSEAESHKDAIRVLSKLGLKPKNKQVFAYETSYGGGESALVVQDASAQSGVMFGPSENFVDNIRDLRGKGTYTIVSWTRDAGELPTDLPMSKFKQYGKINTIAEFNTALLSVLKTYAKAQQWNSKSASAPNFNYSSADLLGMTQVQRVKATKELQKVLGAKASLTYGIDTNGSALPPTQKGEGWYIDGEYDGEAIYISFNDVDEDAKFKGKWRVTTGLSTGKPATKLFAAQNVLDIKKFLDKYK